MENDYEYYYMGYYIHNCVKMRYKGDYKPQYVLDPMNYSWNPLDDRLRSLLDEEKFVSLPSAETKVIGGKHEAGSETPDTTCNVKTWQYQIPAEAAVLEKSLLEIRMPGVMTVQEIMKEVDLDHIKIGLGPHQTFEAQDLVSWSDSPDITSAHSLKGVIAELVACVGPSVARDITVDFSR